MTTADWISTSSVIVALCAMFATVWQAYLQRNHGRLSVRPHLDWVTMRAVDRPVGLTVQNNGLGPALVTRMTIHWREQDCEVD